MAPLEQFNSWTKALGCGFSLVRLLCDNFNSINAIIASKKILSKILQSKGHLSEIWHRCPVNFIKLFEPNAWCITWYTYVHSENVFEKDIHQINDEYSNFLWQGSLFEPLHDVGISSMTVWIFKHFTCNVSNVKEVFYYISKFQTKISHQSCLLAPQSWASKAAHFALPPGTATTVEVRGGLTEPERRRGGAHQKSWLSSLSSRRSHKSACGSYTATIGRP